MLSSSLLESQARRFIEVGSLLALISCQDNKAMTPVVLMPTLAVPTATAKPISECVLPRENLSIDWQPWEENLPLTFTLPGGRDTIFTRKSVLAKNRDGVLKPGIWMTIERIGPPDWQRETMQQGFLRPLQEAFLTIEGLPTIAFYACDEEGKEIYWADLSN